MSPTDWKDILSAAAADMPDDGHNGDDNIPEAVEPHAVQHLTLIYERKGRKGKPATIIIGFDQPDCEVARILSQLQRKLGVGGSSRGGEILLQGDCRERVAVILREMGHKVKGG